jgi:hypothetical protein
MGHAKTNSIWFMEMFVADSKTSGKYLGMMLSKLWIAFHTAFRGCINSLCVGQKSVLT